MILLNRNSSGYSVVVVISLTGESGVGQRGVVHGFVDH
jgi:hypothetical protein